ncbi:MAG: 7-cyano-7-deazaguanine synthase QueC [Methanotrichaceae archaeon]|nr:7-cyano-7-deazaguanine synthase QueC [Methanotrichaceae archaeon]
MGDGRMKKAVCLCSGGLDSTVAATIAKRDGYELYIFHLNYGQKAEAKEREVIGKIKDWLGAKDLISVDIDFFKNLSALTSAKAKIPIGKEVKLDAIATPSTWVHCRNLVFVSLAAAYAEYLAAEKIFVGFNAEEGQSYPDNRPEFVERFNCLLDEAVASFSNPPQIEAPLLSMFKSEIVTKGKELAAPMHLSWSCYLNGEKQCGECASCQHRRRGFREAGVPDLTEYASKGN